MVALSRDARMLRRDEVAKRSNGDEQQYREKNVSDSAWDSSRWRGVVTAVQNTADHEQNDGGHEQKMEEFDDVVGSRRGFQGQDEAIVAVGSVGS